MFQIKGQTIVEIPEYTLECGETLYNFPVAYKTWGKLNSTQSNAFLICHALTGSSDVQDWWGPLLGINKTFDPSRYFIICINFLGSPYGSCSPVTIDKSTGKAYGPNFPLVTAKDDVRIQKIILDQLNVKQIACVIGGSMGGMIALEYSSIYNDSDYVKTVIALATSARASAWCISWNETQRQCIFNDPAYDDGYYYENGNSPTSGLAAARMAALLTYRSRNSFETRFGRNKSNDLFTAQSYLRYQGNKFINRFDANCYIAITRKLDTHDITRDHDFDLEKYLQRLKKPHLIIGIESDGLFTISEQELLGKNIPNSILKKLTSPEGHDAFLLEFELINNYCLEFLKKELPEIYESDEVFEWTEPEEFESMCSEVDNITNW
ncbi:unnamed protein product [Candida verbasci]|uniref:AB hydrolase-1 domain-containing protein n=1 Tax=Candida verbasci TaxID=1227364 RepID=A0A9W4TQP9_9ASCO|nr:unnamed protein product [Candida verbasci]